MLYFQDRYPNDKGPCREYFFNILNTIYPQYLEQVLSHASRQRYTAEGEDQKKHAIQATDEWYEALQSMPYKSSKLKITVFLKSILCLGKNGKTLHLLK